MVSINFRVAYVPLVFPRLCVVSPPGSRVVSANIKDWVVAWKEGPSPHLTSLRWVGVFARVGVRLPEVAPGALVEADLVSGDQLGLARRSRDCGWQA